MLSFLGDVDKIDAVLLSAILLKEIKKQEVTVVAEDYRNYQFFNGEVSGIVVAGGGIRAEGLVLYDGLTVDMSMGESKLVLVTNYERRNLDFVQRSAAGVEHSGILRISQECGLTKKSAEMYLPPSKTYEYADDVARRLDIVHNGKFDLRNVDNEFLLAIGTMVSELLEVDMKDVKSVLNALRKGR